MNKVKSMAAAFAMASVMTACGLTSDGSGVLTLDNGRMKLQLDRRDGTVAMLAADGHVMIGQRERGSREPLWHLLDVDGKAVEDTACMSFSIRRTWFVHEGSEDRSGAWRLRQAAAMTWELADGTRLTAHVRLGRKETLSYWKIKVEGAAGKGVMSVRFPIVGGFSRMPEERLAVSTWQGSLYENPREGLSAERPTKTFSWSSPDQLTMQLVALYGEDAPCPGLYFSSNDNEAMSKEYRLTLDSGTTSVAMDVEFPEDGRLDTLDPGFETVIGAFRGDWHEAAALYRRWAVKQPWANASRFHNGLTPEWAQNTAVWVWNRNTVSNVLPEAEDLSDYLGGLPVSVLWHWWHNCPYDDGFPNYLPPRDGEEAFTSAVDNAASHGIHTIVYMNSIQWGSSTPNFTPEVQKYKAMKRGGGDYSNVFNVFTGHALTPMCMATDFWRQKYASMCDTVVNRLHADGVYMDQACMELRCYDPGHGHPIGGGNYWIKGFGELEKLIRKKTGNPALGGEGSGEIWMPHLDLFLTLEASRERYMGVGKVQTIPLYQAVYHDYAITFGSYSSLVYPPYDDLWPDEYRPANRETELPEEFNMQFRMEQARGFVWGTQPMIANYHSFLRETRPAELEYFRRLVKTRANAPEYLGRGICTRCPPIAAPKADVPVSRISIYAGRWGSQVTSGVVSSPLIFSEGWKSADGGYAVALTNISDGELPVRFELDPADYGIRGRYRINLITSEGRVPFDEGQGLFSYDGTVAGRDCYLVEICEK